MELRGTHQGGMVPKMALLCCASLCLFSVLTLTAGNSSNRACSETPIWRSNSNTLQGSWRRRQRAEAVETTAAAAAAVAAAARRRRDLLGPGSHPPLCTSKCGGCTPCWPVHVPVPPRAPAEAAEYYPEAWRCKCGGRLYVP